ncbi:hypothetical protein DQ244_08970 [Blastococcus sp. TBT05-19]|uniref:hypothetical protein n=1 Tax=Blastococcus sp. TBT05-19 TaxID=2250581 RepID=UPI000DEBF459|nr:hypothetical protein [Blastococcus sp. TBT05-19]RBY91456.1 hypothetical protein DQ244_08970 [Blastococcus sp. TBT05-19]
MLELTRLARGIGFVFLGYFAGWPLLAVLGAVLTRGFDVQGFERVVEWWIWPVPGIFPVLSVVLAVDFFRRLRGHRLRPAKVGSYRFVALLLTFGAGFAVSRHWAPLLISGLCLLAMFAPVKKRAAASVEA